MSVQRKTVVPVILEKGLALNGWLGIVLGTKLYFSLTRFLNVVASHDLYVYDTQCTEPASRCIKGVNDTSVANTLSLGLNFLFDYRHQLY